METFGLSFACNKSPLRLALLLSEEPSRIRCISRVRCAAGDGSSPSTSYLSMWKRAKQRYEDDNLRKQKQQLQLQQQQQDQGASQAKTEDWQEKERQFALISQTSPEERDRIQRMQVVDRAAAALAAAEALLAEKPTFQNSAASLPDSYLRALSEYRKNSGTSVETQKSQQFETDQFERGPSFTQSTLSTEPTLKVHATPGPDFWTWSPPELDLQSGLQKSRANSLPTTSPATLEKETADDTLIIPFESTKQEQDDKTQELSLKFQSRAKPSLPPLQSLLEVQRDAKSAEEDSSDFTVSIPDIESEVASVVQDKNRDETTHGVNSDGTCWWKETGTEERANGVLCTWTVIRGVNRDGTEWEEKFWEALDDLDYKELGAEKSGRDSHGNVWREFWKEAMWQDPQTGLLHIEKTADKWAKNGFGGEWHEKWWEHYDASGYAEKWADKWSKIDPTTVLEPGHAHVWHERWGEKFDGQGGAMKYTDKWAERAEYGGSWSKWGDKWDEHFDMFGNGVKQGETWWEGANRERWNRTWGEQHNGTGWVHKYGKSSSGEHWDTHEKQETWYERHPHFGFQHCMEHSRELQRVGRRKQSKYSGNMESS